MRLDCGAQVELCAGGYHVTVAPAAGARITSLAWREGGVSHPLLVNCDVEGFDEHDWPKAGAFPMIPFANRLAPRGLRVGDREARPEHGPGGFPVHGFAHRRVWELTRRTEERAVMRLLHDGASEGWPWAWSAEEEVRVAPQGVTVRLRVKNESDTPMPLGLGWHPYHPICPQTDALGLAVSAGSRHDLDPEGRAGQEARLPVFGMNRGETAAFDAWSGTFRLALQAQRALRLECLGARRLVLHRPTSGDYLCVEPVTVLPGHLGREGSDAWLVAPGSAREILWSCGLEPAR